MPLRRASAGDLVGAFCAARWERKRLSERFSIMRNLSSWQGHRLNDANLATAQPARDRAKHLQRSLSWRVCGVSRWRLPIRPRHGYCAKESWSPSILTLLK